MVQFRLDVKQSTFGHHNNILGHFSLEELLELWNQNKRINFDEFMGLPVTEAETKKEKQEIMAKDMMIYQKI